MKLKDKIKELEQRYRLISDNMADAMWVIDAETHKFEYVSPSIEIMTGFTPDEYMNLSMEEMLGPESFHKVFAILADEKKRFVEQGIGTVHTLELQRAKKDGSVSWVEIRARLYREKGKPIKIVGLSRDIDERKKAEMKQNELVERLGQALAEKRKLLKENKVLRGLLPICSGCRRIRDENSKWWPLDEYVKKKTDAKLTHTICPDCKDVYYGDILT